MPRIVQLAQLANRLADRLASALTWLPPTLARVVVGVVFVQSGWGKLGDIDAVIGFFTELGLPLPAFQAYLASVTELVCGALLLLGLATRFAAVPIVVTMIVAIRTALWQQVDGVASLFTMIEFLYIVLCVWLGVHGAGPLSIDGLVERGLRARFPQLEGRPAFALDEVPQVVIVGAGFGGLACAAELARARVAVTLIDRHNYHLFQPLLYQVATAGLSPGDIATPVRGLFRDRFNVRVLLGEVSGVDRARREVVKFFIAGGYITLRCDNGHGVISARKNALQLELLNGLPHGHKGYPGQLSQVGNGGKTRRRCELLARNECTDERFGFFLTVVFSHRKVEVSSYEKA